MIPPYRKMSLVSVSRLFLVVALLCQVLVNAYVQDGVQRYMTEDFSAPVLLTTQRGPIAPGYLFLAPQFDGPVDGPMIMTSDGELVWRLDQVIEAGNMDHQTLNGTPVITYWNGVRDSVTGLGYGGVSILNSNYEEVYHICGAALNVDPIIPHPNTSCQLDSHESRITTRGSILVTVRSVRPANLSEVGGSENGWVLDSLFYELDIPSEKVLFRWSAYEHRHKYNFFQLSHLPIQVPGRPISGTTKATAWDFFHMNAVSEVLNEGASEGYITSSRYLCSIIKVGHTGHIDWLLQGEHGGDFDLEESGHFCYQHDPLPRNVSSTHLDLQFFDNQNAGTVAVFGPRMPSSGLKLHLDLSSMKATLVQRLSPYPAIYSQKTGNNQPLNYLHHSLVDFGHPARVNEFDKAGNVVWDMAISGEATVLYRVYKKPWEGNPNTQPKVVAYHNSSRINVWMSWNGATNLYAWQIYGRSTTGGRLRKLAEVPNYGFETHASLPHGSLEIQTFALLQSDAPSSSRRSPLVRVEGAPGGLGGGNGPHSHGKGPHHGGASPGTSMHDGKGKPNAATTFGATDRIGLALVFFTSLALVRIYF